MGASIDSRTVAGLMAYCDWLKDKGYAGSAGTDAWKSAAKVVFETVEGEAYESLSLDNIDLDDYVRRFQTLGGAKYRAETVARYRNRIRTAIEAQAYYVAHGKPPSLKKSTPRPKQGGDETPKLAAVKAAEREKKQPPAGESAVPALVAFPFPVKNGTVMAELRLPPRLDKTDADRISAFVRTLQFDEQRQLTRQTGEDVQAA